MAEGGRSQSVIASHKDEPIRGSESARTTSERTLVSFESFESTTMLPDCRGWLMETESRKQFWCVAASKMLGLFSTPEADEPIKVLTLTNFRVETFVNDVDMSINGADNLVSSEQHVFSIAALIPRKKEFVIALKALSKGVEQHLFLVPSEEEHLLWRKALQASCPSKVPSFSRRDKMLKQKKISFEEPCRTDSGLGDDLEPPLDHRKSDSGDTKIQEPTSFLNGAADFDNRGDQVCSRGSSFVSSVGTIDDLADSNSTSDSASVGNTSAVNLSEFEFPDVETNSCGRQSLNDSVFLGTSQDLDLSQWSDSKDADCFTSDGDSLPNSPHPRQTSSSMSSAGDVIEGTVRPPSDQTKTMISKVSKLVHRVAHMRRPRSNSSLTLAQIPDSKMSGPMRKKGKLRWYVLSGTCLYCFKSNSKDEEAEVIYDLSSYTVALATEEKEDKRSICVLKLTHSSGKKVLFTINNMETAQLWFNYTQDAIREISTSKSRSDSQKSTSSNPDPQSLGRNRLSRQSFEDSYGFFERQSSLRCVRDALQNAVTESPKITKQDSSSGSSGGNDESREGGSPSDLESITPPATHWASSEDLSMEFTEKKSHPAIRFIMKHSSKSQLISKRSLRQMPIPAAEIVDPTMTGLLSVYVQNKATWKKYWTVLKDDWLYFYKRPTDTSTSDIIEIPLYTIQRERRMADSAPLTQQRFIFSVTDEDGSDRAILMADTETDTRTWMNKLKSQAKQRRSTMLDGLNLESGQSSLQSHKPDSHSNPQKWQKNQTEIHKQRLLQELVHQQNQGGQQRTADSSKSALENPEVTKKRAEIHTKYQKANDNEEEEQVRLMTLLNRRRMSAQVKKDVLERTMASRAKRRMERIGSVEEASMEEQIRVLNERLTGIQAEMHAKSFQKRSRVQSLKDKEDLELQLLEQKERLSRYRLKTHEALKSNSDSKATLDEMDEETLDCGEDSTESPKRRESPSLLEDKGDETDCRDQTSVEKASQRLSPSVQREKTDDDSQTDRSPNTRRRRLLPSLPDKADPKLNIAEGRGDVPGRSSHQQEKLCGTGEKSPTVYRKKLSEIDYLRQRSVSDVLERKTPSPVHSRKISIEARLLPDTKDVPTSKLEASHRSDSVPHLPQASQEVSRGVRTMKHSVSSSDMSHAIKKSPGQRRAKEHPSTGAQSSPKPRRKISVPIKMPSMENFFHSSVLKGSKDKTRKISSTSSLSNVTRGTYKVLPQNGDTRSLSSSSSSIHLSTPSSSGSPDINGNMHPRSKGHGGQVEEIDPEVLRDIEDFEMMARKALRDAGWTFRL